MTIRTFEQAKALADAGATEIAGYAYGWTRRISFEHRPDGGVAARLFRTDVVTFHPDHFTVDLNGYVTVSTFDGIAAALGIPRGHTFCGTVSKIPHVLGVPVDPNRPNTFSYDGQLWKGFVR
jgi:hypothetical protein